MVHSDNIYQITFAIYRHGVGITNLPVTWYISSLAEFNNQIPRATVKINTKIDVISRAVNQRPTLLDTVPCAIYTASSTTNIIISTIYFCFM